MKVTPDLSQLNTNKPASETNILTNAISNLNIDDNFFMGTSSPPANLTSSQAASASNKSDFDMFSNMASSTTNNTQTFQHNNQSAILNNNNNVPIIQNSGNDLDMFMGLGSSTAGTQSLNNSNQIPVMNNQIPMMGNLSNSGNDFDMFMGSAGSSTIETQAAQNLNNNNQLPAVGNVQNLSNDLDMFMGLGSSSTGAQVTQSLNNNYQMPVIGNTQNSGNDLDMFMGFGGPTLVTQNPQDLNVKNNELDMFMGNFDSGTKTTNPQANSMDNSFMMQTPQIEAQPSNNNSNDEFFIGITSQPNTQVQPSTIPNIGDNNQIGNKMDEYFMGSNQVVASNQNITNNEGFSYDNQIPQSTEQQMMNTYENQNFNNYDAGYGQQGFDQQYYSGNYQTAPNLYSGYNNNQANLNTQGQFVDSNATNDDDYFGMGNNQRYEMNQGFAQSNNQTSFNNSYNDQSLDYGFGNQAAQNQNQSNNAYQSNSSLLVETSTGTASYSTSPAVPVVPSTNPVGDPKSEKPTANSADGQKANPTSGVALLTKPTVKRSFNPFSVIKSHLNKARSQARIIIYNNVIEI